LALRMEKHSKNGMKIAEYLESHPKIDWVRYPGLKSHPQYEIGLKQHKDFGGMVTFELKGGFKAGETVMNSVKLCQLAVSLGGVESLIQHPASMTHLTMGQEAREKAGITEGLVRLSVGVESSEDIISDLDQALNKL
ncbi:MAG: PLP-dependent transferase, partial [Melioribacteraceae bacterium]|nr:PLP-dependent transferase [Melioribacteraceae bacterium]